MTDVAVISRVAALDELEGVRFGRGGFEEEAFAGGICVGDYEVVVCVGFEVGESDALIVHAFVGEVFVGGFGVFVEVGFLSVVELSVVDGGVLA